MSTVAETSLRVALFVEGSRESSNAEDPLEVLWRQDVPGALGLAPIDRVIGFSKHHLVAMDRANRELHIKTSTVSYPLDEIMAHALKQSPFDVAVVCWDLQPQWDSTSEACRWEEVLNLYRGLAASTRLPKPWTEAAANRLREMKGRARPAARNAPPQLRRYATVAVWMKPDFEGMLADEVAVREALGLRKERVAGWPTDWKERGPRKMDALVGQAIAVARRHRPPLKVCRKIRVPFGQAKHEWASWLIRNGGERMRASMRRHATGRRLIELLRAP